MTTITIEPKTQLILAGKVNGTPVFDVAGDRIGHVQDLAIEKTTGQVAYAVLSFGGILGLGEKHHPIPWSVLTYDTLRGGYVVSVDKEQLEHAPSYHMAELADLGDNSASLAAHWGPFI